MTEQLRDGVRISAAAIARLEPWMKKTGVGLPSPV
jgi:hypothetical protein